MRTVTIRTLSGAAALAFVLAGCGGDDPVDEADAGATADADAEEDPASPDAADDDDAPESDGPDEGDGPAEGGSAEDPADASSTEDFQDMADSMSDSLREQQEAAGGGSASLTVGDQTWEFDSVLCAFGPEEIGQEGAEFVLSSIQDDLQLYLSIDSFGHSVSLNDLADIADPSVALVSVTMEEFIELDGKEASGEADFMDDATDSLDTMAGSFEATCP